MPLQLRRVQNRPEWDTLPVQPVGVARALQGLWGGSPKATFPVLGSDGVGWQRAWPSRPVAGHLLSG